MRKAIAWIHRVRCALALLDDVEKAQRRDRVFSDIFIADIAKNAADRLKSDYNKY